MFQTTNQIGFLYFFMGANDGSRDVLMASTGLKTALPARPRYFPRSMRSSPCTLQANFFPWLDHVYQPQWEVTHQFHRIKHDESYVSSFLVLDFLSVFQ